jgi:hypothetical protein
MQYTNYGDEYGLFPKGGGCSSVRSIGMAALASWTFLSESSVAAQNDTVVNDTNFRIGGFGCNHRAHRFFVLQTASAKKLTAKTRW